MVYKEKINQKYGRIFTTCTISEKFNDPLKRSDSLPNGRRMSVIQVLRISSREYHEAHLEAILQLEPYHKGTTGNRANQKKAVMIPAQLLRKGRRDPVCGTVAARQKQWRENRALNKEIIANTTKYIVRSLPVHRNLLYSLNTEISDISSAWQNHFDANT